MKYLQLLALPAALLLSQTAAAKVIVATDSFATNGSIVGQTGGSGFDGAWGGVAPTATVTNNALTFTGNSAGAATRLLDASLTGSIFVDFTLSFSGELQRNDFLGFWFGSSDGPNIGLKGNCDQANCANDVFVRNSNSSTMMLQSSALAANTTYHIFGHLYKTAPNGNYNRFDAWLNPTAYEMANLTGADATSNTNSGMSAISAIGFRSANLSNGVSVTIDDLRLQTVPEPGSFALLGLGLLGMGLVRRRK